MRKVAILALVLCLVIFTANSALFAHDGQWGTEENPIDIDWLGGDFDHQDADPWKGWAILWVKNICGEDWGDFHFEIKSIFGWNIENVDFLVDPAPQLLVRTAPLTWEPVPITWDVDNDVVGATLDLYFYSDPIEAGQWAAFKVYTDNTDDRCAWFRVSAHPTPVPEPATIAMLGLGGLIALLRKRQ